MIKFLFKASQEANEQCSGSFKTIRTADNITRKQQILQNNYAQNFTNERGPHSF